MSTKKWLLISVALLISVVVVASVAHAVSLQAILAQNSAMGLKDTTAVAWINNRSIPRGTVVGLAETIMNTGVSNKEEAYQDALNLITQNSLFLQEATKRGLIPTDQEVEARVQELLKEAKNNNKQLQDIYIAQATELGITWDGPEFRAYLVNQMKEALPAEKLNAQIGEQVQGDTKKFNEVKAQLLSALISSASIRLDTSALPEDAKDLHIPQFSELPVVKAAQAASQATP